MLHYCLMLYTMLFMCTFLLSLFHFCINELISPYDPSKYRGPTRNFNDLVLKLDRNIKYFITHPKSAEEGIYFFKYMIGYIDLLDRTVQLAREKKVLGIEMYLEYYELNGPTFTKRSLRKNLPKMQSTFHWTSKEIEKLHEFMEATKFKWFQLRTLGKRAIEELSS